MSFTLAKKFCLIIVMLTILAAKLCDSLGSVQITGFTVPALVQKEANYTVSCSYQMLEETLISLELRKDGQTFYIYYPAGSPEVNVFGIRGLSADQMRVLNDTRPSARTVEIVSAVTENSGLYECVVSTTRPSVVTARRNVDILSLPDSEPTIAIRVPAVDLAVIQCSVGKSRPGVQFQWELSGVRVAANSSLVRTEYADDNDDRLVSSMGTISLTMADLENLTASRIVPAKCVASLGDRWRAESQTLRVNVRRLSRYRSAAGPTVLRGTDASNWGRVAMIGASVAINAFVLSYVMY